LIRKAIIVVLVLATVVVCVGWVASAWGMVGSEGEWLTVWFDHGAVYMSFGTPFTFLAPCWFLVLVLAAYPTWAFIHGPLLRYRRRRRGECVDCGYSLTGNVSGVCPECGTKTEQP
jgi:hypothetical protein